MCRKLRAGIRLVELIGAARSFCVPACSKILFMSFGTSPGMGTTGFRSKNRQWCQNVQLLCRERSDEFGR